MLYGLGMLIAATPAHTLLGELSTGLMEGVAWMKEVLSEDADEQSRMLAGHALTLLNACSHERELVLVTLGGGGGSYGC